MADDRQNPNDPSYDWLYSGDGASDDAGGPPPPPPPSQSPSEPPGEPAASSGDESPDEATSVISPEPADEPPAADNPEATQVLAIPPPPPPEPTTPMPDAPPDAAPEAGPQSFGGTFPAPAAAAAGAAASQPPPPPTDGPRFATPSDSYQPGHPSTAKPGQPPPTMSPPGKPRKRKRWWLRILLILLALWIIFLIAVPIWAWQRIDKVDAEPSGDRPADTAGTTYLLVGSDSREGLSKQQNGELGTGGVGADGGRTDTIILMHVPSGGGPTLMLSIPRDSYVDIPGHGKNKINAAYAFGGPDLLVQTVEEATNVRIDNYIEVGFSGFVDIVDAVGGITVCPKQKIDDPKAGNLKMKPGCQEVDGATALKYSRSRAFALGDITRAEHQREVISAVGSKAASWQTVLLPWRYFSVAKAGSESVAIGENVGPFDLVKFAWAMGHSGDAKKCVVPYSDLGASTSAGSAVIWDEDKANAIFDDIRNDDTSAINCTATGQAN